MWQIVFVCFSIFLTFFLTQPSITKAEQIVTKKIYEVRNTVAIVQYSPIIQSRGNKTLSYLNARNYLTIMRKAKSYGVDIIIFPEKGLLHPESFDKVYYPMENIFLTRNLPNLRPYDITKQNSYLSEKLSENNVQRARSVIRVNGEEIADPKEKINLCQNTDRNSAEKPLKMLSCAARDFGMYVVLHTYEKDNCIARPPCQTDGYFLYSTAVVLDRNGNVIIRYRKRDVYDEPWLDTDKGFTRKIFTTDFNATFELLIGSELLKKKIQKVEKRVTDVILMTEPHDDAPFYLSIQDQITWAIQSNVNLLVAGFSKDGDGGIYNGRKEPTHKLASIEPTNHFICELVVKPVSRSISKRKVGISYKTRKPPTHHKELSTKSAKKPASPLFQDFDMSQCYYGDLVKTHTLEASSQFQVHILCVDEMCCHFVLQLTYSGSDDYTMKLAAMKSIYKLNNGTLVAIELCLILACSDSDNLSTCAKLPKDSLINQFPFTFEAVMISRTLNKTDKFSFVSTSAMTSTKMLVEGQDYNLVVPQTSKSSPVFMHLNKPKRDIVVFGIVNQVYGVEEMYKFSKLDFAWHAGIILIILIASVVLIVFVFYVFYKMYSSKSNKRKLVQPDPDTYYDLIAPESRGNVTFYEQKRKYLELIKASIREDDNKEEFRRIHRYMLENNYHVPPLIEIFRDAEKYKKYEYEKIKIRRQQLLKKARENMGQYNTLDDDDDEEVAVFDRQKLEDEHNRPSTSSSSRRGRYSTTYVIY